MLKRQHYLYLCGLKDLIITILKKPKPIFLFQPGADKDAFPRGIPIAPSLNINDAKEDDTVKRYFLKKRLIQVSLLSVAVAILVSIIARLLIYLIDLVTNISFFGRFNFEANSPSDNHLGLWVIIIPAIGGILVGLMALYGSKAIRGHGIPEAMEQILVNKSKIKPSITFLKPLSSAIAIGTGGPFGAEGPIIATGGALGSTLGQIFKITPNERKVILAAGATAGMSAIFGTPIAAIFLAIELLLFEFSPKTILPVALACITGAAGHHLLFESGPVFHMPDIVTPGNTALAIYSLIGIILGFLSTGLTKIVYAIEDAFEKLPIHWMWWPAIGGLAVGCIGYFAPYTLGVGYDNITMVLSGTAPLALILNLLFLKCLSWAIALGSGTSGGTLAPLLTIGGACGAALGALILKIYPESGINIPLAALVGMAAMFAGASRAFITSITFALEATMQSHALLPLLGACTASYLISFFLMENTIMTEKIARRGIQTPDSYEPNVLNKLTVGQVIQEEAVILNEENTIQDIRSFLENIEHADDYFLVVNAQESFAGFVHAMDIFNHKLNPDALLSDITKGHSFSIKANDSLSKALSVMSEHDIELLPVISTEDDQFITGVLSYKDIMAAYKYHMSENEEAIANLSLKRQRLKVLAKGRNLIRLRRN
jgi:H+/Cl- antiporter ClcA